MEIRRQCLLLRGNSQTHGEMITASTSHSGKNMTLKGHPVATATTDSIPNVYVNNDRGRIFSNRLRSECYSVQRSRHLQYQCDSLDTDCNSLEVDSLVENMADFHISNSENDVGRPSSMSVSMETTECVDSDIVAMLDFRTEDGDTLLMMEIIYKSDFPLIMIDLSPSPEWLNVANSVKQTALHLAVITRQVAIVRRLMVGGAKVAARNINGDMPLHLACERGYTEIVKVLLEPVWYWETKHNKYEICYQKIPQDQHDRNREGLNFLQLAAATSNFDIMNLLLDAGADINVRNPKTGRTLLHEAFCADQQEMVEFLLKSPNCDIHAKAYDGTSFSDFPTSTIYHPLLTQGQRFSYDG